MEKGVKKYTYNSGGVRNDFSSKFMNILKTKESMFFYQLSKFRKDQLILSDKKFTLILIEFARKCNKITNLSH